MNVGYQLSNKKNYWDFTVDLKARTNHCKGIPHSFDCFTVTGKALNEYEDQIASLVTYLSRSYGIKFESLVCDFVKDELGNAFFTNLKGFKLADAVMYKEVASLDHYQADEREAYIQGVFDRANNSS